MRGEPGRGMRVRVGPPLLTRAGPSSPLRSTKRGSRGELLVPTRSPLVLGLPAGNETEKLSELSLTKFPPWLVFPPKIFGESGALLLAKTQFLRVRLVLIPVLLTIPPAVSDASLATIVQEFRARVALGALTIPPAKLGAVLLPTTRPAPLSVMVVFSSLAGPLLSNPPAEFSASFW